MRWRVIVLSCLGTIVACATLANRTGTVDSVFERDGARTVYRRGVGPFLFVHKESLPSLRVSDDLRAELRRLGLRLPPPAAALLPGADRSIWRSGSKTYGLHGEFAGSAKDVVDAFARQLPHSHPRLRAGRASVGGLCADGRSRVYVSAWPAKGRTEFGLFLTVR